jgi:hypothetical protein
MRLRLGFRAFVDLLRVRLGHADTEAARSALHSFKG